MNNNQILFCVSIILISVIFIAIGLFLKKYPPKEINYFYGYRSKKAMKNIEQWNYSQKKAALELIRSGILILISLVLVYFLPDGTSFTPYILFLIVIITLFPYFITVYKVEKALKKAFTN